jgi:hypothetical protein
MHMDRRKTDVPSVSVESRHFRGTIAVAASRVILRTLGCRVVCLSRTAESFSSSDVNR